MKKTSKKKTKLKTKRQTCLLWILIAAWEFCRIEAVQDDTQQDAQNLTMLSKKYEKKRFMDYINNCPIGLITEEGDKFASRWGISTNREYESQEFEGMRKTMPEGELTKIMKTMGWEGGDRENAWLEFRGLKTEDKEKTVAEFIKDIGKGRKFLETMIGKKEVGKRMGVTMGLERRFIYQEVDRETEQIEKEMRGEIRLFGSDNTREWMIESLIIKNLNYFSTKEMIELCCYMFLPSADKELDKLVKLEMQNVGLANEIELLLKNRGKYDYLDRLGKSTEENEFGGLQEIEQVSKWPFDRQKKIVDLIKRIQEERWVEIRIKWLERSTGEREECEIFKEITKNRAEDDENKAYEKQRRLEGLGQLIQIENKKTFKNVKENELREMIILALIKNDETSEIQKQIKDKLYKVIKNRKEESEESNDLEEIYELATKTEYAKKALRFWELKSEDLKARNEFYTRIGMEMDGELEPMLKSFYNFFWFEKNVLEILNGRELEKIKKRNKKFISNLETALKKDKIYNEIKIRKMMGMISLGFNLEKLWAQMNIKGEEVARQAANLIREVSREMEALLARNEEPEEEMVDEWIKKGNKIEKNIKQTMQRQKRTNIEQVDAQQSGKNEAGKPIVRASMNTSTFNVDTANPRGGVLMQNAVAATQSGPASSGGGGAGTGTKTLTKKKGGKKPQAAKKTATKITKKTKRIAKKPKGRGSGKRGGAAKKKRLRKRG